MPELCIHGTHLSNDEPFNPRPPMRGPTPTNKTFTLKIAYPPTPAGRTRSNPPDVQMSNFAIQNDGGWISQHPDSRITVEEHSPNPNFSRKTTP